MGGWHQLRAVSRLCQIQQCQQLFNVNSSFTQLSQQRHQHDIALSELPSKAEVVICGAGMIGNSIAYHLVKRGWNDIVIIEKGDKVASGTSKYGSGMLGLFRPKHERKIVEYCIEVYSQLQEEGYDLGLVHCGSVNLASTEDRMISLRRRVSAYKPTGIDCHLVPPEQIKSLHKYVDTDGILGGVWVPKDACVDAGKVSEVFAYIASQGGAKFVPKCGINKVVTSTSTGHDNVSQPHENQTRHTRIHGVDTEQGFIECKYFINTAGIWAREIGKKTDTKRPVRIPIAPAEHFFMRFQGPISGLDNEMLPIVRDYDSQIYVRQNGTSMMMGAFENLARPYDVTKGIDPDWNQIREEHWMHFQPYIAAAQKRIPILKEVQYESLLNTPDAFTPDGKWILGETPEVENYFVCAGMNGNSLQGAAGVGKAVADWVIKGYPPGDMLHFEVQRFAAQHNNAKFLSERAKEVVGKHYKLEYPLVSEFTYGRKIRSSSIHSELEARGGVFGERMGWEIALYFEPYHHREDDPESLPDGSFQKPEFFDQIEEEYHICREGVGLIDMSSFAKFIIKGEKESVVKYLQNLCTNDVDVPNGNIVPTAMLNNGGGYENDCILVRRGEDSFMMVSPSRQQTRTFEWLENYLPEDNTVGLQDVTSMYTVLSIVGPKARDLMNELSGESMDMQPFSYKMVNVGYASGVMVMAVTNTGEPGYSLYIPSEFALQIYDNIMSVGRDYGIRNVGQLAMRFLRIEKFIPFWAEELTSETTPLEVNRSYKVKFDKESFIGKDNLQKQKEEGLFKRLVQFQLVDFDKDNDIWPWGGESVYRNEEFVGSITSAAYGFTMQKMVALGFVKHPSTMNGKKTQLENSWFEDPSAKWTIDIAGKQVKATIHLHSPQFPIIINNEQPSDFKPKKNVPREVIQRIHN